MKKITVKMSDIIEKMSDEIPETFFGNDIFLPANMTKAAHYSGSAIEAVLLFTFRGVGHSKFLLK
jgi:hypothetical protein